MQSFQTRANRKGKNSMDTSRRSRLAPVALSLLVFGLTPCFLMLQVHGQVTAVAVEASVTVEGRVANVFQSNDESLVQILVQKSELQSLVNAAQASYPAPGEYVYVHVSPNNSVLGRFGRRSAGDELPKSQSLIRAALKLDQSGQWAADGRGWFEPVSELGGQSTAAPGIGGAGTLGLTTQRVKLGRETALKVVSVTPNSPAAAAGIEPGDTLVQVNRQPLESEEQLEDVYRRSPRGISLTVRDVRSGRDVEVDVEPSGADAPVARTGAMRSLGVTSKLAFFGGEPALEVTAVAPGSPAQQAGITTGLLITQANGKPVKSPEELQAAERESRGRLELKLIDPKERREQTVRVEL